ncbi:uncharacterized protein LOC133311340 isoform X2 [Gastrolobium bilobum]|uniref:uncharacterized protein LOC133311340 isoform X2 n=1 Tax=Gastrolobium bilobum TaxID=150636 RepID=UPI002AB2D67D|nr:uncharacterized protein LOC133311340 isoform X2 [Gastrolobium bilobum]
MIRKYLRYGVTKPMEDIQNELVEVNFYINNHLFWGTWGYIFQIIFQYLITHFNNFQPICLELPPPWIVSNWKMMLLMKKKMVKDGEKSQGGFKSRRALTREEYLKFFHLKSLFMCMKRRIMFFSL